MVLAGVDGTVLEVGIESYQFPLASTSEHRAWDANWLIICGKLALPDGRMHTFRDPCLTTWEARALANWLAAIADGTGDPSPHRSENQLDLVFTEPCLAFDFESRSSDAAIIRVYLSLEAEPPFIVEGSAGLFDNYVRVKLSTSQLAEVAADWRCELAAFPHR